jgi:uncharacterized SAM-binding protein YcdF (DUF218 family)
MSGRVVAVLGYSRRRDKELHRICAERLAHAEEIAVGARAVVLSGMPESELMRSAWSGPEIELICDPDARSTADNVRNVAAAARSLDAEELVVVTSRWHSARVHALLRAALRGSGIRASVESANGPRPLHLLGRELVCLALLPFQLTRSRRTVG